MDGEPPPISKADLGLQDSSNSPERIPTEGQLLKDIIGNSYARLGTFVLSDPGVNVSGGGLVLSRDEFSGKVKRGRQKWNNSTMDRLLNGRVLDGMIASGALAYAPNRTREIPLDTGDYYRSVDLKDIIRENPIVDFVYVGSCSEFDMKTQQGKPERNWFGKSKKTTEEVIDLENPHSIPFNEIVTGEGLPNTDEPAALFVYQFTSDFLTNLSHLDKTTEKGFSYKDLVNRPGNSLIVVAVLPESIGEKMQDAIGRDPMFAREVAMGLVDNKFDLKEGNYRRPNYDEMQGKGLKMYIALDLGKPLSPRRLQPHLFDQKNVVDIDTAMAKGSAA